MFYIHQSSCIFPQKTLFEADINKLSEARENKLVAIEPSYEGIPPAILRRMGKAVRIGIGAAMPLLQDTAVDGVIIGTANGGMEDCIKFLNQIIEYQEGTLTPTNFVQSTSNAIAAQVGLLTRNKGYNITHVHRGLAFENAIIDAVMQIQENSDAQFLLGGVDEISTYNYNIEYLANWYKKEPISPLNLYASDTTGSIAGEGAAMFVVNGNKEKATARLNAIFTLHTEDKAYISNALLRFLHENLHFSEEIDILISGENGDNRLLPYYQSVENTLGNEIPVVRYKHLSGEFETSTAIALKLACGLLEGKVLPRHMLKQQEQHNKIKNILLYNTCKGYQHSFILLSQPNNL